jgi:carbon monoxide dehydrogenase subunit G
MKVQLQKTFPMPGSADTAWSLLQDLEGVAACLPGAKITERIDDKAYKGSVAVKLGPASLLFRGEVRVTEIDSGARSMRLVGKGTDSTGSSGASMDLSARVEAIDNESCNLTGTSEVAVNGKVAAFGARIMGPLADQVLQQFAGNFAAMVQTRQAQSSTAPAVDENAPLSGASSPAASATPPSASVAAPSELNGLALLWAVLKGWLRSLFGARRV